MKNFIYASFVFIFVIAIGACSEPEKGESKLNFSISTNGAQIHGPYGTILVVPENAVKEDCDGYMSFANEPPSPQPDGSVNSICVYLNIECESFDKLATLQIPLFNETDTSKLAGMHTKKPSNGWDEVELNIPNNGYAQMKIGEGGFYVVMEK